MRQASTTYFMLSFITEQKKLICALQLHFIFIDLTVQQFVSDFQAATVENFHMYQTSHHLKVKVSYITNSLQYTFLREEKFYSTCARITLFLLTIYI